MQDVGQLFVTAAGALHPWLLCALHRWPQKCILKNLVAERPLQTTCTAEMSVALRRQGKHVSVEGPRVENASQLWAWLLGAIDSCKGVRAGNYGSNSDIVKDTPTNFGLDIMMSVAASDLQDAIPMYSNYGASRVHLAAPGSEILSTVPNGRYFVLSGARPRRMYPVLQDGCGT